MRRARARQADESRGRGERESTDDCSREEIEVAVVVAIDGSGEVGMEQELPATQRPRHERLVEPLPKAPRRRSERKTGSDQRDHKRAQWPRPQCFDGVPASSIGFASDFGMRKPTRAAVAATTSCWLMPDVGK